MAQTQISSIQSRYNTNLAKETEKYVIEALANLGQRYGTKGDGVEMMTLKFRDLFEHSLVTYDSKVYCGVMKIMEDEQNKVKFYVTNKADLAYSESLPSFSVDIKDMTSSIAVAKLPTRIDEIDIESIQNAHIYADNVSFTFGLTECEENDTPRCFVCEKYNRFSNILESGLLVKKLDVPETIEDHSYDHVIFFLNITGDGNYKLYKYFMSEDALNSEETSASIFELITKEISGDNDTSFTPESLLTQLYTSSTKNLNASTGTEDEHDITIFRREQENYSVSFSDGSYHVTAVHPDLPENATSVQIAERKKAELNAEKEVQHFAYDKAYVYGFLKESHSNYIYKTSSGDGVNGQVELFRHILKDFYVFTISEETAPIYVDLDYEFTFAVNSNDYPQIYYATKDICLRDVLKMDKDGSNPLFTVSTYVDVSGLVRVNYIERAAFYNYAVNYDSEVKTNIYNITINKHFTLPYINKFGYWVIDDIDTEIYARGKDAGNPNFVIVETDINKDKPTIVTNTKKEYLESLNWVAKNALIRIPNKIVNTSHSQEIHSAVNTDNIAGDYGEYLHQSNNDNDKLNLMINCTFQVPTLNNTNKKKLEENIEQLQYCLIVNVSSPENVVGYNDEDYPKFKELVNDMYGSDGKIITFWTLDQLEEEACGWGFKYLDTDDSYAYDMQYLTNLINTINWVLKNYRNADPDNFTFTRLVFDQCNMQSKNNENDMINIYPVITYENAKTNNASLQGNNLNLKIKFNDSIEAVQYDSDIENDDEGNPLSQFSSISSTSQSSLRYIDNLFADKNYKESVQDSIYTYQYSTTGSGDDNIFTYELIPNSFTYSVPYLDLSEVIVKDSNTANRLNVISFGSNQAYYGYIGARPNGDDKSVLTIGTSTIDLNLGNETLVTDKNTENFTKHRQVNIEFDNTRITAYAYIGNVLITEKDTISYGTTWRRYDLNGTTYWTTRFKQIGKFAPVAANFTVNLSDSEMMNYLNEENNGKKNGVTLRHSEFIPMTAYEKYSDIAEKIYISDMIGVDRLINKVAPTINPAYISKLTSDNEVIYCYVNNAPTYFGVRLNSTMLKDEFYKHAFYNETFLSNELEITYYKKSENDYVFTINDLNDTTTMSYIHKIKERFEYTL